MTEPDDERSGIEPARWAVVALVVAISAASLLYKLLLHIHLGQSAAMFLGVPVILTVLVALSPKAKTVTGGIMKGITLALLIIAPLLGEGFLCILLASPLFYLVGIVVGLIVDWQRRRRNATLSCIALILLPMCLEGVVPELTLNRTNTVEATQIVSTPATAVEQALAHSPRVDTPLPLYLRIGFPRPLQAWGDGLAPGETRTIHFAGAEGDPPGDLVMRIVERRPNYVRFETVSDSSKLTQWLKWDSSEIQWKQIDAAHTSVTWQIHFERQLDPAWYFVPWERAAVHEVAKYLIQANAISPERAR
ncbi:MAG TPA: hypothetical protein VK627_03045 [Edaphobacter sp.]|nr:hypothetical protein [Edaphobacter sp.]